MSELLDQPTSAGPPPAHFPNPGDTIVVGLVDVADYHQRDYDTNEPKFWPDGGAVMGKRVTGLVISADGTADVGSERNSSPVEVGQLVTFWCEGGKHYTWRDAVKDAGGVAVGDIMQWKRDDDEPSNNPRHNARKVYTARIRKPEGRDGDIVERCQQARREMNEQRLDEPEPARAAPVSDPF